MKTALSQWLHHDHIPRAELLRLASFATGQSREALLAHPDSIVAPDAIGRLERLIARRAAGEPMAYLLGHREFYGRDFAVDPRVLIPRPETELLVELAISWLARREAARDGVDPLHVLDLGTGSGIIAITLALECPAIVAAATDVSADALDIAAQNARALAASVSFARSDWFSADTTPERGPHFDLIVSNPPYIAAGDPHLYEGDLRHEPRMALTDDADGLRAIGCIIAESASRLRPGGCLMLEHGYDQAATVRELLLRSGFARVASWRDLAGIERVTEGTRRRNGRANAK